MSVRRVYLVRHGETLYQGAVEHGLDLTERGIAQIRVLAEGFKSLAVDRVIASPLARASDTASLIAAAKELPVTIDDQLREITAGSYDGMSGHDIFSEILEFFGGSATTWDTPYLGGETYRELRARAQGFVERMLAEPSWETLVAVAHGGINNAILSLVLDVREKSGLLNVEQDFGCVNVIDFDGARATLRLLNYTSYDPLKAELRLPAVHILGDLVRARLGPAKDDARPGERREPGGR